MFRGTRKLDCFVAKMKMSKPQPKSASYVDTVISISCRHELTFSLRRGGMRLHERAEQYSTERFRAEIGSSDPSPRVAMIHVSRWVLQSGIRQ